MNIPILKRSYVFFLLLVMAIMTSCNNNDYEIISNNDYDVEFKANHVIDNDSLFKVSRNLDRMFAPGISSRASITAITTLNTKIALAPLVPSGKLIQNELINEFTNNGNITCDEADLLMLQNMTDEELAAMAYCIATTESAGNITFDDVVNCLGEATGIKSICNLLGPAGIIKGTKMAMTARTALQIAKCVCVRYAGYVGTAYMIYSFANCINKK